MQKYISNPTKSQSKLTTSQEISVLFGLDSASKAQWRSTRASQVTIVVKPSDNTQNLQTITLPAWQAAEFLSRKLSYNDFADCHVWVSQNVFNNERSSNDVAAFTSCYLDIDCYKTKWGQGKSAERLANDFIEICKFNDVPVPSIINFSGQGLQVKWLFERPLSAKAAPRWQALQEHLLKKFVDFGADPQSIDAARILRVVGSENPKPSAKHAICRTVFVNRDEADNVVRHDFELLCEAVLPYSREEAREWKMQRLERLAKRQSNATAATKKGSVSNPRRNTALVRLRDLATLRAIRYPKGIVNEGERMKFLFWEMNYACLAGLISLSDFDLYATEKASQIDESWMFTEAELSTLKNKFVQTLNGELTEDNRLPLYTPKRNKLIQIFEITPQEQLQLENLCNDEKQRQKKANDSRRAKYSASESMSRVDRHNRAQARADRARELHAQGLSIRAISKEMQLSVSTIHSYLASNATKNQTANSQPEQPKAVDYTPSARVFGFRCFTNGVTSPLGGADYVFDKKTSSHDECACSNASGSLAQAVEKDEKSKTLKQRFVELRAIHDDLRLIAQLLQVDFKTVLRLDLT